MKKILFIAIVLCSACDLIAQTEKGKFYIGTSGASLGLKKQKVKYDFVEYEGQTNADGSYDRTTVDVQLQGGVTL